MLGRRRQLQRDSLIQCSDIGIDGHRWLTEGALEEEFQLIRGRYKFAADGLKYERESMSGD